VGASQSNADVIRQAEAAANELFNGLTLQSPMDPQGIMLTTVQNTLRSMRQQRFMLGADSVDDLAYLDRGDWILVCSGPATALRLDAYVCVFRGTTVCRAQYEYRDRVWRLVDSGPNAA
jgi:hypothetical protein